MDPAIVTRLVCPSCSSALGLEPFATDGRERDTVSEGVLLCERCHVWYPISAGVPVLVGFPTPVLDRFASEHRRRLARLPDYQPPHRAPRPDERSVQETFTEEWACVTDSELSFTYSLEDEEDLVRDVWLKWTQRLEDSAPVRGVLEVGCGLGSESLALREVLGADIFAVDLNLALLQRGPHRSRDGVHYIVASLFDLPFRPASFDLAYSMGVLHHTRSTEAAFEHVAAFVRPGGHLFVWVYGRDDHLAIRGRRGLARRAGLLAESALRPGLSRSPRAVRQAFFGAASRGAHPILRRTTRHGSRWGLQDTDNYLRDWLSPRFAHRHSFNEVISWFEQRGFDIIDVHSPSNYERLIGKQLWGVGVTGRRGAVRA
jgi:SAM-dependent methyltransferase/uncharacterized protein YbaR (Trm112 family)